MYCTKTNICYFLWESINIVLSVLFATEACYTIKEHSNKEKSFWWGRLLFFAGESWEKPILRLHFFLPAQITILPTQISKAYFALAFSCREKKKVNCKGCVKTIRIFRDQCILLLHYIIILLLLLNIISAASGNIKKGLILTKFLLDFLCIFKDKSSIFMAWFYMRTTDNCTWKFICSSFKQYFYE